MNKKIIYLLLIFLIAAAGCKQKSNDMIKEAASLFENRKTEQSLLLLNKTIEKNQKKSGAYILRGHIYLSMKKYDESMNDFKHALKLDKGNVLVYYGIAAVHLERNELNKALINFDKAISVNRLFYLAYFEKARVYSIQKKRDKALESFEYFVKYFNIYKSRVAGANSKKIKELEKEIYKSINNDKGFMFLRDNKTFKILVNMIE